MDDLISRQAAIEAVLTELTKRERKNLLHTWSTVEVKYFTTKMLEDMPSAYTEADIQKMQDLEAAQIEKAYQLGKEERKKGKWFSDIAYYDEDGCPCIVYRCSECGEVSEAYNFCPNCGSYNGGEE